MRKIRFYAYMLTICMIVAFMGLFCMPVHGEENIPTVKVGYFQMDGYNEMDDDGIYSGYDYDFFQLLSRYTSLNFEFTGYHKSWQEMQEMLSDGEIDILTSMHITEERSERYEFSYDIGSSCTMLTAKMGNNRFQNSDYSSYNDMKVGMLSESSQNDIFDQFSREKGFTYEPVYFKNSIELSAAVRDGTVDTAVTSSLRRLNNERVIEEIYPNKFYAVVRKGQRDLLDEINQGITQMDLHEGDWRSNLYYKYYGYQNKPESEIVYSEREQEILSEYSDNGRVLRVCFEPTLPPYSFVENGEMKGILPDAIGEIMDSWGINYEYVVTDSYDEYRQMYIHEGADIFPEIMSSTSSLAQRQYIFTDPYFTMNVGALMKKSGYKGLNVIATLDNQSFFKDLIVEGAKVVSYDSMDGLFEAVAKGDADLAYLMNYTAQMYVNHNKAGDLTYVSQPDLSYDICFAVSMNSPHEFCSIFNKNIPELAGKDMYSLSLAYLENDMPDLNFMEYMQLHTEIALALFLFAIILIIAIMILVFINIQNVKEKKINAERAAEREKQRRDLQSALMAAEEANRAKTVFLSNMSHDIRTPMNAIIGFSTLAAKHIDNQEQVKSYIDKISAAGNHLLSLINDVLDMSRIERGKVHLDEEKCSLSELIHNLCNIISSDLRTSELKFLSDTENVVDEQVICDKLRLNQVLLNLLSNAIKFTEPGGSVRLSLVEKPGDTDGVAIYEFHVADTGIGISEEFISHVFEPFERERTSTVSGIPGTGLGMPISKNIVEMMGGTIAVKSKKGEGSEFTVTVPMRKADDTERRIVSEEQKDSRVLLVEQDQRTGESILMLLRQNGMRPDWVETGREAVLHIKESIQGGDPYQIYMIDVNQQDMKSTDITGQIRRAAGDAVPVICLTSCDAEITEAELKEAGATAFIPKPLFLSDIRDCLKNVVSSPKKEIVPPTDSRKSIRGKRILLVEDNDLNREIAVDILSEAGLLVEEAEDGSIAVERLLEKGAGYYQLVIMDVQMPVMDGYTASRTIRSFEDSELAGIPIIAMTANAFDEDKQKAMEAGMNAHIAKPIVLDTLFDTLAQLLEKIDPEKTA